MGAQPLSRKRFSLRAALASLLTLPLCSRISRGYIEAIPLVCSTERSTGISAMTCAYSGRCRSARSYAVQAGQLA
jgi:hypothetical protein